MGAAMDTPEQKRTNDRQQILYHVLRAVSGGLDLDRVARSAVETIVQLTGYPHVCLAILDDDGTHWVVRGAAGSLAAELGATYTVQQGVIGRALATGQMQWIRDNLDDPYYVRDVNQVEAPALRSEVVTLVCHGDRRFGALNIESTLVDAFDSDDIQMTQSLADVIALALENVRLYEQAQREIAERKRVEESLERSESRFRRLAENAEDLIYRYQMLPPRGFEYVSPAATAITGYTPEEHYADPDLGFKLVHPEDRRTLEGMLQGHIAPATPIVFRWVRKDGTIIWTEQRNVPIFDNAGNLIAIEGIARDITQRKHAEEALRESEARLRQIASTLHEVFWLRDTQTLEILYVNQAYETVWGRSCASLYENPTSFLDAVHPDDKPRIMKAIATLRENGISFAEEYRIIRPDGSIRWVWGRTSPIQNEAGQVYRIAASVVDITERKRVEEALRESQTLLAKTFVSLREAVFIIDAETVIISDCNPAASEIFGYTWGEMVGQTTAFLHVNDATLNEFREQLNTAIAQKGYLFLPEFKMKRKDGQIIFTEHSVTPIEDERGNRIAWVSVVRDISERMRAEEALRDSEEKYRQLFELESDAIFLIDNVSGDILEVNASATTLYGYSRDELMRMRNTDLSAQPDDTRRAMEEKSTLIPIRYHRKKDGTIIAVEITASHLTWHGRSVHIAAIRNITERKRTEDALRHLSTHDAMTGLYNRAFFQDEFDRLRTSRQFPISMVIADVDGMKMANDTLGHFVGDELLIRTADVFRSVFRVEDIIARIGGDEFAVLLPQTDALTVNEALVRCRMKLAHHNATHSVPVHLSMGAATAETSEDFAHIFRMADENMYQDKASHKGTDSVR